MAKKNIILLPKERKILILVGENIKLARLRRKYSMEQVSERANITRPTLLSIEKGSAAVSMGAYLKVLMVLGLQNDLSEIARDDELGRKIQDAKIIVKERAPKQKTNHE
jgi:transcriptional regulator with XRE-family HTH domain